jgi:hypothetical protein
MISCRACCAKKPICAQYIYKIAVCIWVKYLQQSGYKGGDLRPVYMVVRAKLRWRYAAYYPLCGQGTYGPLHFLGAVLYVCKVMPVFYYRVGSALRYAGVHQPG